MANISTYPIGTPSASDLLAGTELYTDSTGKQENLTRNFTVQSVASFANSYSWVTQYIQHNLLLQLEQHQPPLFYKTLQV